jgi:hypothetical protein
MYLDFEVFTEVVMMSIIFWDVPPKRRLHLNRLHGVTSQKMILFMYLEDTHKVQFSKIVSRALI